MDAMTGVNPDSSFISTTTILELLRIPVYLKFKNKHKFRQQSRIMTILQQGWWIHRYQVALCLEQRQKAEEGTPEESPSQTSENRHS